MSKYTAKDIFTADECGLFNNMLPNHTYTFKEERFKGIRINKERITILFCANVDGSENLPLFVVGQVKNLFLSRILFPCLVCTITTKLHGCHVKFFMSFWFASTEEWHERIG
jgi:hypothetical protein